VPTSLSRHQQDDRPFAFAADPDDAELEAAAASPRSTTSASVCIKPYFVKRATELLKGTALPSGPP